MVVGLIIEVTTVVTVPGAKVVVDVDVTVADVKLRHSQAVVICALAHFER